MKFDLVPEQPPSGDYESIVTAMGVISNYLIAYPTTSEDAKRIPRVLTNIMTVHADLTTTMSSDKGSAIVSQVNKNVAEV